MRARRVLAALLVAIMALPGLGSGWLAEAQTPPPPPPAPPAATPATQPATAAPAPDVTPVRISYLHGELSFWRPGATEWAPARLNTPAGARRHPLYRRGGHRRAAARAASLRARRARHLYRPRQPGAGLRPASRDRRPCRAGRSRAARRPYRGARHPGRRVHRREGRLLSRGRLRGGHDVPGPSRRLRHGDAGGRRRHADRRQPAGEARRVGDAARGDARALPPSAPGTAGTISARTI